MLKKRIKQYLAEKWDFWLLSKETGLSMSVLISFFENKKRKYTKNTLDILYDFFGIEHDDFYNENIKKWYPKTPSLFGSFIRGKRIDANIMIGELAREIKVKKRTLVRLESWDSLPSYSGRTMTNLMEYLKFSKKEMELSKKYIAIMKELWLMISNIEKEKRPCENH